MNRSKVYVNGREEQRGDFKRAKELLVKAGIYQQMENFGPYFPNKESRCHKKLETFILEDMEFFIIESEVMSVSISHYASGLLNPHTQKEAWFQPIAYWHRYSI